MKHSLTITVLGGALLLALTVSARMEPQSTLRRVPMDYPKIQQAINSALDGDTILVAPGIYVENINFLGKAITVTSEAGPEVTTIDGAGIDAVVVINHREGPLSVLSGFTIRNGGQGLFSLGGGIVITISSPTITRNIVTANSSFSGGGGISIGGDFFEKAEPLIKDNKILNNKALFSGAGIKVGSASPVIQDNIISENGPLDLSTGGVDGAGIYIQEGSPQIKNNEISNNVGRFGGGVTVFIGTPTIVGNVIRENKAREGAGLWIVNDAPVFVIQNLVVDNVGDGIYWSNPPRAIISNTIANNTGPGVSAGFSVGTQFVNNIVVAKEKGNAFLSRDSQPLPTAFESNDIFSPNGSAYLGSPNPTGLNGNISVDPLFVNSSVGEYHLRHSSPCIDAGKNEALNLPLTDLDGKPRLQNRNGDGLVVVDMGVYEAGGFSIEDGLPPIAPKDVPYTYQFAAVAGVLPYQWSLIEGNLPLGLRLSTDGTLSGIPTSLGVFTFTLRARDSAEHESRRKYSIGVVDPPRIVDTAYKKKKQKLTIFGEHFDASAILLIDGEQVKVKHQDSESFTVKALSLSAGPHELRVVNPDGGSASVQITVE